MTTAPVSGQVSLLFRLTGLVYAILQTRCPAGNIAQDAGALKKIPWSRLAGLPCMAVRVLAQATTQEEDQSVSDYDDAPLAEVRVRTPITVIIPTYQEAENIPLILDRLSRLRAQQGLELQVLIMDDNSDDGTEAVVERLGLSWVELVVRTRNRGLSESVVDGLKRAKHPVVVVMDADLSHPPERIPELVLALQSGQQMALGSRYVPGAKTDDTWGFFRWLNSRVATVMAWPLTSIRDPMSGFFALRRAELEKAHDLNPVGYKIALELIVKCGLENVGEVPIHFENRRFGQSKLTVVEQLKYLRHLRRLYTHKYGAWSHFAQFAVVGLSGVLVNVAALTLLLMMGLPTQVAVAGGILLSVVSNFLLNRRITFSFARHRPILRQFLGFCGASSLGAAVNYVVTLAVVSAYALPVQLATLVGVAAGMFLNFVANRFFVFRAHQDLR
jgi:dolichol-phosphate mannosyltransferase